MTMNFNLENITRENIKTLAPYSSARDEYKGNEGVFLDANENPYGSPILDDNYNRYPDPLQLKAKAKISTLKAIPAEQIFLGNGSDEAIDILFRAFCEPGKDNVIICPPTYGMYEVSANINNVSVMKVPLTKETFQLDTNAILKNINDQTNLIFVCCPNNPTGNGVKWADIKILLESFKGIVVVDEAYIDFASFNSLILKLPEYKNLVILQTFSKGWGLAGLRVGMAFASTEIIDLFNKIKPPYNINAVSQQLLIEALNNKTTVDKWAKEIINQRSILFEKLVEIPFVLRIYDSEANFILVKVTNAKKIYQFLTQNKMIIRDRSNISLCDECLRITIGTQEENKQLINLLKQYK